MTSCDLSKLIEKVGVTVLIAVTAAIVVLAAYLVSLLAFPWLAGVPVEDVGLAVVATAAAVAAPICFLLVRILVQVLEQKCSVEAREDLLRASQRFARIGTWEFCVKTRTLRVSDNLQDLLGDPGSDLEITVPLLLQMTHPEDRDMVKRSFDRILLQGAGEQVEFRLTGIDGVERTLWLTGVRATTRSGAPVKAFGVWQDATEHVAMQAALQESEDHYRHVVELSPLIPWTKDPDGTNLQMGERWQQLTGLELDLHSGTAWTKALHPEDVSLALEAWSRALETSGKYQVEYRLRLSDGRYRWFRAQAAARLTADGKILRWYGTLEDIHDRKTAEIELRESEAFAHSILDNSADCVVVLDLEGRLQFMNEPGLRLLEIADFELFAGKDWARLWPKKSQQEMSDAIDKARGGEAVRHTGFCPTAKGNPRWWDVCISPIPGQDGKPMRLLCTSRDITLQQRSEENLRYLAEHDSLTGLSNRAVLREELTHALGTASGTSQVAVLFLDLDEFKSVNDSYGHPAGDELLQEAALRLRRCVRAGDKIARFGGDEFAILQTGLVDLESVRALAERVIGCLSEPYVVNDHQLAVGASIGISVASSPSVLADDLLKQADIALYRAKAAGRGACCLFEPGMEDVIQQTQLLKTELREALSRSELHLQYQPLVDFSTSRVRAFEALLRWRHPERGLIPPCDFIPVAEQTGLILEIGEWALREACHCAATWPEEISISVNLSPVQFRDGGLVEAVSRALQSSALAPHRLQLEITESVLLQDSMLTLEVLQALRALGVRLAMDDFGIGYSSLNYLRNFPFDNIKIDRSFIEDMPSNAHTSSIVGAVMAMGRSLGISTTAEGIETFQQAEVLRSMGCHEGQGYLFSRPVNADEVPVVLDRLKEGFDENDLVSRRVPVSAAS